MKFEELKGKTLIKIDVSENNEEIVFTAENGDKFALYHRQDCCESVQVEDICGDISDLIGTPLLLAEEVEHEQDTHPPMITVTDINKYVDESFLWTFYKLGTVKGYVTIRWLGYSNGFYSESVSFKQLKLKSEENES